jgi:serine/threonine-protein kinase
VADFGIARALEAAGRQSGSSAGVVVGVPGYLSPEQARGSGEIDGRSDIYSLGCMLYEMLGGTPPFTGSTSTAVLARQISEAPPPLKTLCPHLPDHLEPVVLKALAKRPEDRFSDALRFAAALEGRA